MLLVNVYFLVWSSFIEERTPTNTADLISHQQGMFLALWTQGAVVSLLALSASHVGRTRESELTKAKPR